MSAAPWGIPRREARPVRWGLPDAAFVWAAGIFGVVVATPFVNFDEPGGTFWLLLPQQLPVLFGLWLISQAKGQRSVRRDFGLEVRAADIGAIGIGVALQAAFLVLLAPLGFIDPSDDPQRLLEELNAARSVVPVTLFVLGAVVAAPLVEEGLYRGLILRGLARRIPPGAAVFTSAMLFAGVHLLGDPNALRSIPGLALLGAVLGAVALRTGSLSKPILIHAGFNLTSTVLLLATGS